MSLCNDLRVVLLRSIQSARTPSRPKRITTCQSARTYSTVPWCQQHLQTDHKSGVPRSLRPNGRVSSRRHRRYDVRFLQHDAALRNRAFIALGSNMGDRIAEIEKACKMMNASDQVKIVRTSSLYETKAMYVLDQDNFINGACEVVTSLEPLQLLDFLQSIENNLGRVKVIDKGPRNIDLDILVYARAQGSSYQMVDWSDERLVLPHKLMFEREFVLRPLYDILPNNEDFLVHLSPPKEAFKTSVGRELDLLKSEGSLYPLTRLGHGVQNLQVNRPGRETQVMSILNVTPDSFSDGGKSYELDQVALGDTILGYIGDGASMIDIGGQSTRPGAAQATAEEELRRVLPVVNSAKPASIFGIAISVDTYRADVARAAVKAGAHIINDVSAGLMDKNMLSTAAELGCTVCLMHMRGTPETMNALTHYPDGLIETVGKELLERVQAAEAAGIYRWRIILDPGIGFAKTLEQNLELLRQLNELRQYPGLENLPWLVGTSRKAFIGKITKVTEAKDRVWGTAATVAAAVQGGADIVRVHDVKEMTQVVQMADAIWRR